MRKLEVSKSTLTGSMKGTIALNLSFLIFLVAPGVATLLSGPWDIYILFSLVFFVPILLVLSVFCWRRKKWAYMGTIALGVFVVVATPLSITGEFPPLLMWQTVMASILGLLMALEGFKAYTEL